MKQPELRVNLMTAEIVKSLNWVRSRSLIHNQFNFEWWNHKKNINLENLSKEKKIAIKIIGIKFDRKKTHERRNCKTKWSG